MPSQDLRAAPPGEDRVRAAHRPVLWFSVVLLAALWLSVTRPPWPLPLVPGLLAAVAVVLGIVGLVRMHRARVTSVATTVLVAVGIVFAAGMVVVTAAQALMWPVYAEFHACLDRALTHRAQDACFAELEQRTQDLLLDLIP